MTLMLFLFFLQFATVAGVTDSVVNFHADVLSGEAPLTVQFTADTSIYRNIWNWDFGDGTYDHAQNPVHTYENPGIYTVSLTEIANGSRIGSEVKMGYIQVFAPSSVSVIPGVVGTPRPPSGTETPAGATPLPPSNNQGAMISQDAVQLMIAGGFAGAITAIILYMFNNMGKLRKRPGEKPAEKPAAKPKTKPQPPAPPAIPKPEVKTNAQKPAKKSEEISQDYLYGLVTGNADSEAERTLAWQQKDFRRNN